MAEGKAEIFLSYGREPDTVQFVKRLKRSLEEATISVWLDTEDIRAGQDWHAAIGMGLHHCKGLVCVITHKYLASKYCASELYVADGDHKELFPVFLEDVDFTGHGERGHGVKYAISGINWTFCRPEDDYAAAVQRLVVGMREKGEANSRAPLKPSPIFKAVLTAQKGI